MLCSKKLTRWAKSGPVRFYDSAQAFRGPAPYFECADGFKMSMQAGPTYYCTPRTFEGPYTHFEVANTSGFEELLLPYSNSLDDEFDDEFPPKYPVSMTIYSQVPVEVLIQIINAHGGQKESNHAS